MEIDEALHHVGGFGNYQRLVGWLLLLPGTLPVGLYTLLVLLQVNDRGKHWCNVPDLHGSVINKTLARRFSIPLLSGNESSMEFSSCLMYDINYTQLVRHFEAGPSRDNRSDLAPLPTTWHVTPCRHGWQYSEDQGISVIAKFELVCDQSFLASALVGGVGTAAVLGQLVTFSCRNRMGRRWTFLLSLLLYLSVGVASVSCRRPVCLLLTSCSTAAAAAALGFNQLSLVLDLTTASDHQLTHVTERLVTSGGLLLLAGLTMLTRHWNTAVYGAVLPCAVFLVYWCVMPESPALLLRRGHFSELHRILERISRVNGQPTDVTYITEQLQENVGEEVSLSWEDFFFSTRLQRRLATLLFLTFLASLTFHEVAAVALARSGPSSGRTLLLMGLAQLLACPLAWALAQTVGRRSALLASLSLTAGACSLAAWLHNAGPAAVPGPALEAVSCLLTLLSEASLLILLLTGCSLLPSLLVSHGLLLVRSAQLLGYAAQPALSLLQPVWRVFAVLAGLHGIGAVTSLLLPETLHEPRPRLPSESHEIRWPLFRFSPRPPHLYNRRCCRWHSVQSRSTSGHLSPSPSSAALTRGMLAQREMADLRLDRRAANGGLVLGVPRPPRPSTSRADQMYITVL